MNAHTPFDANQDWTNPYCQNSSNDPMVDALLGNAYHVVRTVYCNLGNLKLIYDFLNQYGMVLGVQSEAELKALTTKATFARIYDKTPAGDRQVTDYLYVEGDRTGVIPDDVTATGSWVKVATSNSGGSSGDGSKDGGYIPWIYNSGSANGGETTIRIPDETAGAPFMIVNGDWQTEGYDFEYDPVTFEVSFTTPLEPGDFVVVMRTGVPATPDNPNVSDWVTINWLYNQGAAVGGEQVIDIPYTFQSVPAVYKNGLRFYKSLPSDSYTVDSDNNRIILTEPLVTNDRLIVQLGGEAKVLEVVDHTIQEVARSANVKDSEVILSTDTTQVLNGKKVVYSVSEQKSYGLPVLPTNVYIQSVANGKLTYNPGSVIVDLLPTPSDALTIHNAYRALLTSPEGAGYVGYKSVIASTIERTLHDVTSEKVSVKDFGAKGDGVTDDTQALLLAVAATRNNAIALHFPKGKYLTSQPLNFTRPAIVIGEPGARIELTGGNHDYVFQMDFRDTDLGYWAYEAYVSNIIVDGKGFAKDGFSLRGVISSTFDNLRATNVTRAGLHCWWTQCNIYTNFHCSNNVELFTTKPKYGILIDYEEGAPNKRGTSADTFINPVLEHVTEAGIEATFCINTVFINGTSEGNRFGIAMGHETDLEQTAVTNQVIGMDLEVNSGGDLLIRKTATGNLFNGVMSGYESPSTQVQGGRANRWIGGSSSGFDFYNGAADNHITGTVLLGASATIVDSAKLNSWDSLYNISTATYTESTNPVNKRTQLNGASVLFNPLRCSLATVNIDTSSVTIDLDDNARDGQRLNFILYNTSGGAVTVTWSDKFRIGGFVPPEAGRQKGLSFVYDANFAHWYCVGESPDGPIY